MLGFVDAVLHLGRYPASRQNTDTLPPQTGIDPGAGQSMTNYARNEPRHC